MADDGEQPPSRAALYGGAGERNTFGKVRKERKHSSTPYARPPRPNGWISRIVDPAKRLLSGGATRFMPSFFSSSSIPEEIQSEVEHATEDHDENISVELLAPASSRGVGSSVAAGNSNHDVSGKVEANKEREHSDGGLPDIEQLIKHKSFSRKEIGHLMEILQSRVVNVDEGKAPSLTEKEGAERAQTSKGKEKASVTESEEIDRFQYASTPLQRPSVTHATLAKYYLPKGEKNIKLASNSLQKLQGEIGTSPVDIARAYMGSRASEGRLTSASLTLKNEKWAHNSDISSMPVMPSPLPRAPICWPGAVTQTQQGYSTPQNQKSSYVIRSLAPTPYSRTMYSKSKSKLTPLRGDSERLPNIFSTPLQPRETPTYGKSISSAAQGSYGSGGPIRRTRNKFTAATPVKESPLSRSIQRSPFSKEFNSSNMVKNNSQHGTLSTYFEPSNNKPQVSGVSVPSAHPHSSKLARHILEHIDRPVTLKEQSKELKLAILSKNSVGTQPYSQSNGGLYGMTREKSDDDNSNTGKDVASSSKVNPDKISALLGGNDDSSLDIQKLDSQCRSQEQEIQNNLFKKNIIPGDGSKGIDITSSSTRSEPKNVQRKPFLPSITVGPSRLRNQSSSDTSTGFTFPVTTSTNTYFDLPTPTVMPSSLTTSPPKPNGSSDSKIKIAPPVYSLPPTSITSIPSVDVGPKFKFGSGKARLSFSLEEDDTTSSSDAPSIIYKFGSGKTRLSFGSIASDALCC